MGEAEVMLGKLVGPATREEVIAALGGHSGAFMWLCLTFGGETVLTAEGVLLEQIDEDGTQRWAIDSDHELAHALANAHQGERMPTVTFVVPRMVDEIERYWRTGIHSDDPDGAGFRLMCPGGLAVSILLHDWEAGQP